MLLWTIVTVIGLVKTIETVFKISAKYFRLFKKGLTYNSQQAYDTNGKNPLDLLLKNQANHF